MEVLGAIRLLLLCAWPRMEPSFFPPVEYGIAGAMPTLEDLDFFVFGMMTTPMEWIRLARDQSADGDSIE